MFVLVDIYMVLGPPLEEHLAPLNASQLRLVRIYINRMHKARAERAALQPRLDGQANQTAAS